MQTGEEIYLAIFPIFFPVFILERCARVSKGKLSMQANKKQMHQKMHLLLTGGLLPAQNVFQIVFRSDDGHQVILFLQNFHDAWREEGRQGREHPVGIALPQGHDAVGGEQNGRGDVLEFDLLVLPRSAEITFEVGVFPLDD